jgi:hypothetical protein
MSAHTGDRVVATTVTTHGGSDMRAAFTGLIVGAIALFAIVVAIVMLTNRMFEGHEAPAAGGAAHGQHAPAPGAPAAGAPSATPGSTPAPGSAPAPGAPPQGTAPPPAGSPPPATPPPGTPR